MYAFLKILFVITIEIVVNKQKKILIDCQNLFARIFQTVFPIAPKLRAQRAKRAPEIAVSAGFDVAQTANPIGQIEAGVHLFGYSIITQHLPRYIAKFLNISQTTVVKEIPCIPWKRTYCGAAGHHDDLCIEGSGVGSNVQHAIESGSESCKHQDVWP